MAPYLMMLSIPAVFAMLFRRRSNLLLYLLVLAIFVLFMGLRIEVGPDWGSYLLTHWIIVRLPLQDVVARAEPLSKVLFWFSQSSGYEMLLTNMVAALLLMTGVLAFSARTMSPWIAVVAATPYLILVFGMSGVQQAIAVGIFLFILSAWQRLGLTGKIIGVLVAALFHTSALITGIYIILLLNIRFFKKVIVGSVLFVAGVYVINEVGFFADHIADYRSTYIDGPENIFSAGSLFHIGVILIPSVLALVFRNRIRPFIHDNALLNVGIVSAFAITALNFISTTAASRLTLYIYFVPMMVYPALVHSFGKQAVVPIALLTLIFHYIIMIVWLLFGNHAESYLPYQNIILNQFSG